MARTSKCNPFKHKRQTESTSNVEGQENEETQPETKPDDTLTMDDSSSTVSDVEENVAGKKPMSDEEIAKGKSPMKSKKKFKQGTIMFGKQKAKEILREIKRKHKAETGKSKPAGIEGRRRKQSFPVRRSYSLRSGLKGIGEEVASEPDQDEPTNADDVATKDRKRKEKERETDAEEDEDQQEPCRRMRREGNSDDDDDDMDGGLGNFFPGSGAAAILGTI